MGGTSTQAQQRLERLMAHDESILSGLPANTVLIGLDEVGRGCCMGPVVASAVLYPQRISDCKIIQSDRRWWPLNDSKAMSASNRVHVCKQIQLQCTFGIGHVSAQEVDAINVHQASLLAAARAYTALLESHPELTNVPHHLLMDGRATLPEHYLPMSSSSITQQAIIKGDGASWAIASASVLAKQTRDETILALAKHYPQYGWETNVGYPTPEHKLALLAHGPTPHHRFSYRPVQQAMEQSTPLALPLG